jgi:hypothetical protein
MSDSNADDLAVAATESPPSKRMRLRYAGTCCDCGQTVSVGETAIYHRLSKNVQCLTCVEAGAGVDPSGAPVEVAKSPPVPASPTVVMPEADVVAPEAVTVVKPEPVITGTAGASACRRR